MGTHTPFSHSEAQSVAVWEGSRPPAQRDIALPLTTIRVGGNRASHACPERRPKLPCYICRPFTSPQHPLVISPSQGGHLGPQVGRVAVWRRAQISGEMDMRNVIKIVAVLALLGGRGAIAQTVGTARSSAGSPITATAPFSLAQDTRLIGGAPVGHRQPHARDVPSQSPSELERLTEEDAAVDRKPSSAAAAERMMTMNSGAFAGSKPLRMGAARETRIRSCPPARLLREILPSLFAGLPVHFCLVAQIEGALDSARLGAALEQVRRRHPALRVCIVDDAETGPAFYRIDNPIELHAAPAETAADWRWVVERELVSLSVLFQVH